MKQLPNGQVLPDEKASLAFAIQKSDEDLTKNSFRGMASVFNNLIDAYIPTRILPGAFSKTLSENQKRIKVLYQHNQDWPIGKPIRMEENSDGLYVEARISETSMGKDVLTLLRDEVLTELSIGFDPIKFTMVDEGGTMGYVRHISECRLWEFSPVTFGANSKALISSVNSLFGALREGADLELTPETNMVFKHVFVELRKNPKMEPVDLLKTIVTTPLEDHAGKVLSAKNLQLVSNAIEALQKLRDAAEPSDNEDQSKTLTDVTENMRALDELNLVIMSSGLR